MILKELSMTLIDPPGYAVRSVIDDAELLELAEDIRHNGLIHPIVVMAVGERYEVVAGHRRYLAHQLLGYKTINAQIIFNADDRVDAIRLAENYNRSEISPLDEALYFAQIISKREISQSQLAIQIGRSPAYVGLRLALLRLPQPITESLAAGRITASAAIALGKCLNDKYLPYYISQAEEQGANARTITAWLGGCPLPSDGVNTSDDPAALVSLTPSAPITPCWVCGICAERKPASECLMVPICLSCNSQIK